MRIKKIKNLNNSFYEIFLDGEKYKIHEELVLKYKLLVNNTISKNDILKIIEENKFYTILDDIYKYLSKYFKTEYEIKKYISTKTEKVDKVYEKIKHLIDDKTYAKNYCLEKISFSNDGPEKIKQALKYKHIDSNFIEEALEEFNEKRQIEKIKKVIDYRIKINKKSLIVFKKDTLAYLYNLGYKINIINKVLNNISFDDSELKAKELEKLKEKYDDQYLIKRKLYEKGFR
jgi:recX family